MLLLRCHCSAAFQHGASNFTQEELRKAVISAHHRQQPGSPPAPAGSRHCLGELRLAFPSLTPSAVIEPLSELSSLSAAAFALAHGLLCVS